MNWKKTSKCYVGQFKNSLYHGQGTFTYEDETQYDGNWEFGKQSGHGKLFDCHDELIKEGIWIKGAFQLD